MNEAMLTGESVPQVKDSMCSFDDQNADIDLSESSAADGTWRKSLVFSGTTLMQHSYETEEEKSSRVAMDSLSRVPNAPDKGCLAFVVRTGFGTSQVVIYCFSAVF